MIMDARQFSQTDKVFVGIIIFAVVGKMTDSFVQAVRKAIAQMAHKVIKVKNNRRRYDEYSMVYSNAWGWALFRIIRKGQDRQTIRILNKLLKLPISLGTQGSCCLLVDLVKIHG